MGSRAIPDKFEQEVWQRTGHNVDMVLREVVLAFVQEIGQYITAKIARWASHKGWKSHASTGAELSAAYCGIGSWRSLTGLHLLS